MTTTPFTTRKFIDTIRELCQIFKINSPEFEAAIDHVERHGCPPADHAPNTGEVASPAPRTTPRPLAHRMARRHARRIDVGMGIEGLDRSIEDPRSDS